MNKWFKILLLIGVLSGNILFQLEVVANWRIKAYRLKYVRCFPDPVSEQTYNILPTLHKNSRTIIEFYQKRHAGEVRRTGLCFLVKVYYTDEQVLAIDSTGIRYATNKEIYQLERP